VSIDCEKSQKETVAGSIITGRAQKRGESAVKQDPMKRKCGLPSVEPTEVACHLW
jgi:hypothetical protein